MSVREIDIEQEINKQVHRSEQRRQLIIEGVPEDPTENIILTAKQICVDTGVHIQISDLDNAFRLGKAKDKPTRPRNILVNFILKGCYERRSLQKSDKH